MELDRTLIHGNRKDSYDKEMIELFAAGYNSNQVFKILKHNGVSISRGTVYNRWLELKRKKENAAE